MQAPSSHRGRVPRKYLGATRLKVEAAPNWMTSPASRSYQRKEGISRLSP